MKITSLQHVLLTVTLTLLFTTLTFPASLTVPHIGAPVTITAKYGGKSTTTMTTPDWVQIEVNNSTFTEGWQTVSIKARVAASDTPRTGMIEVNFVSGTIQHFTIKQAGKIETDVGGQFNLPPDTKTIYFQATGERGASIISTSTTINRSGWLLVKTQNGTIYTAFINQQTAQTIRLPGNAG